jgi:hypothetical protein
LIAAIEIAFPEVIRDLIKRALFPLFRLRQPKGSAPRIQGGTLSAYRFLTAYFRKSVHEPHSCGVRSTDTSGTLPERRPVCLTLLCKTVAYYATARYVNCNAAIIANQRRTVQLWDEKAQATGAARHIPLLVIG